MRRLGAAGIALVAALALSAPAQAAFRVTGFDVSYTNEDGSPDTQAGSHPFAMTTRIQFSTKEDPAKGKEIGDGSPKSLSFTLPAGLVGDRDAVPHCSNAEFLLVDKEHEFSACPDNSAIGVLRVLTPKEVSEGQTEGGEATPAFNLNPPPGAAAKIGFVFIHVPITVLVKVSPTPPYNLIATLDNISDVEPVGGSELTIWGDPASPAHDDERGECLIEGSCPAGIPERAFLTLPRSCEGPLFTAYAATSWEEPGNVLTGASKSALVTDGCGKLGFAPRFSASPTTDRAESPSGLGSEIEVNDPGLSDPAKEAQSDIRQATVTLPEGMTVNPSAAAGLTSCTPAQLALEAPGSQPGEGCPEASKLGSVEAQSPLLEGDTLHGSVYVAQQDDPATTAPGAENPFDTMIAAYLVIREPGIGAIVKLAGKVEPDPRTGQLTALFGAPGQELPQLPVSSVRLSLRDGDRAPLVTPPACGPYAIGSALASWAAPATPLFGSSPFQVSSGLGGGPCPTGTPPFKPGLQAGSESSAAGAYSPYFLRLTRNDGEQELARINATLPAGVVAKVAGLGRCSDAQLAAAAAKTGRQEQASPSCPASSEIGRTVAGAGVGPTLAYIPGRLYLAGPFGGAQLSVAAITPALAGPFDAGTVVVRQALTLDPSTGEAVIDGSAGPALPHILKGIPTRLRDVRVYVDRPGFALNPTSCDPEATKAEPVGAGLDPFSGADDQRASVSAPYQASGCGALKFKPKLSLSLKGGTKRSDHPALRSLLTYPKGPGYANVAKAVVKLPPSELIDNAHIQNPCTRVQFAAHSCPKGSVLGTARAFSPLLDEPLEGPVYFRSNGGERLLPDVVADLGGLFHIVLVGKVDSRGARVRTTFDQVPDAPVSKFTLDLFGGKRGLLVNNRDLCAAPLKADVALTAKSGKQLSERPLVGTSCKGGKGRKGKKGR